MSQPFIITILISIIRLSIPVVITAFGNMFSEKVGVQNLGAEGMMISGAFGAVLASYLTGNAWLGVLAGIAAGMFIAGIHSLISVEFGGLQNISGMGLNMFAAGLTAFFCRSIFGTARSEVVESIQVTPIMSKIPLIGRILAQFSPILYITIALFFICWYIMKHTVVGLRITACGDDPRTLETAGVNVWLVRHVCVLICGSFAGLAGAYLSLGQLNIFVENMTMGKGMLAVIAVKMGRWDPVRIVLVALMFGFFDAVQLQLQISNVLNMPTEIIQTIPYVVGIVALTLDAATDVNPRALRRPYLKSKYTF